MTTESCDFGRWCDKLEPLYLHYRKKWLVINSLNHLNKGLFEVTWQVKNIKSDLWQYLLSPNLLEWWLTARSSHSWLHVILLSGGLVILTFFTTSCRLITKTPKFSPIAFCKKLIISIVHIFILRLDMLLICLQTAFCS